MKKVNLAVIGILLAGMLIAPGANAFDKGENRLLNSDFETDNMNEPPKEWSLQKGG